MHYQSRPSELSDLHRSELVIVMYGLRYIAVYR